jgi:hypothetical protein
VFNQFTIAKLLYILLVEDNPLVLPIKIYLFSIINIRLLTDDHLLQIDFYNE